MTRTSKLALFWSATAIGAAPAAAIAQTLEPVSDTLWLVLRYLANNPLLFLSVLLTAVLIIGKSLDLIRSFRRRRQETVEGPKDQTRTISERLRIRSGGQA